MHKKGSLKYAWHNWHARQSQIKHSIEMTRDEWCIWWEESGHVHERGNARDQYCMSLIDYSKPYSLDNIECITNDKRLNKSGGKHRAKPVCAPDGTKYTSIREASMATKLSGWVITNRIRQQKGWIFM